MWLKPSSKITTYSITSLLLQDPELSRFLQNPTWPLYGLTYGISKAEVRLKASSTVASMLEALLL